MGSILGTIEIEFKRFVPLKLKTSLADVRKHSMVLYGDCIACNTPMDLQESLTTCSGSSC